MQLRPIHLALAAFFIVASGFVHGRWSNRWAGSQTVAARDLFGGLDGTIGDWRVSEPLPIDPANVPANTQCSARRFLPQKAGKPVTASITAGGPGAVAVHTPDVCYLGAGYKLRGEVTRQTVPLPDGTSAAFWVGDFTKTTATGAESVRVRWSWTADGNWSAPDYPRWVFARAPVLYKLYVVHPLAEEDDLTKDDPYRKFVADLVPALNRRLKD
jgi:hypothetical protein